MEINNLEKFLAKVRAGQCPLGGCVSFSDPAVTEVVAEAGFDFVFIDGEHGEIDRNTAMQHLMAVRGTDCASFYRVPACDHTEIKKVIDFCPAGIIVPMVMNAEQAALAIAAMRYPPVGNRGCGFRRAWRYGVRDTDEMLSEAAHEPLVIIQLEHIDAARRLDKILAVPGVDSILVGPYDFSASMGKPGRFDDPEVRAALDEACARVVERGILLGCYCESDFETWRRRGVRYMSVMNDTNSMIDGWRTALAKAGAR